MGVMRLLSGGKLRLCGVALIVIVVVVSTAEAVPPSYNDDRILDASSGPISEMIQSINTKIEADARAARTSVDSPTGMGQSLDAAIEKASMARRGQAESNRRHPTPGDIGEGDDVMDRSASAARNKADAMQDLKDAQAALTKIGGNHWKESATVKTADDGQDGGTLDPVDEMESSISAQVKTAMQRSMEPQSESTLDKAIDHIAIVRARMTARAHIESTLAAAKHSMELAESQDEDSSSILLQVSEMAPGDPGETMPPSKNAPPGPPNPKVKDVKKDVAVAVPLGRTTPNAPQDKAGLTAALGAEKASEPASRTGSGEPSPPSPDKDFSQQEIDAELKRIEQYGINRDEAISEYVKKMVPWHMRPDPPNKIAKGPTVSEKKTVGVSGNATSNSSQL